MARQLQRRGQPDPFRRRRRLIPVAWGPVGVAVKAQGERAHKTRPVLDLAVLKEVLLQLMKHRLQLFPEGGQPVFQQRDELSGPVLVVQDIASSGAMSGTPFISAWVVGQKVTAGAACEKRQETAIGSTVVFVPRPSVPWWTQPMPPAQAT